MGTNKTLASNQLAQSLILKSRINHTSLVVDFLDKDFDSTEISKILTEETDAIIQSLEFAGLDGWVIQFSAAYTNAKQLLVSKNKLGTYKSDRYKEITVVIPIPTWHVAPWGVRQEQHIYRNDHYDKIIKNFDSLEVDFSAFTNRRDYILDCLRRAISFSLERGIIIQGVKICK